MSQVLPKVDWPDEGSTFFPIVTFSNENDELVVPNSIVWTLTDSAGNIMNNREDVVVVTPASSIEIKLTGDDLLIDSSMYIRFLLIKAIYTSSRGSGQTLNKELMFQIVPIVKIP